MRQKGWTIYRHLEHYPDKFVAREWEKRDGFPCLTGDEIIETNLDTIRRLLHDKGKTRLPRDENDSPMIVEGWR